MKISISFAELSGYIQKRYDKQVAFSKVSDKEICLSYTQNIFFKTIRIPVNLRIEDVKADSLSITYNGGFGIDMIITGAITFLKAKLPELANAISSEEGHRIRIELSKLSQTAKLVKTISLNEITVAENGMKVDALLK